MRGFVYVLSNPSMPGLYKIGCTSKTVEERIIELSRSTGVPTRFIKEFSLYVYDIGECENKLHEYLSKYRVSGNKEFFKTDLETIRQATSIFYKQYRDILDDINESVAIVGEQYFKKNYKKDFNRFRGKIIYNNLNFDWFTDIFEKNGIYYKAECCTKICTAVEYEEWKQEVIKQEKLILVQGEMYVKVHKHVKRYIRNNRVKEGRE